MRTFPNLRCGLLRSPWYPLLCTAGQCLSSAARRQRGGRQSDRGDTAAQGTQADLCHPEPRSARENAGTDSGRRRPLFACGPALGLRKGELFAFQKSDVDLDRGTMTVARSHDRDTTKGGTAAVLPLPAPLRAWIEYQVKHASGTLLDGSKRTREADPQKILRNALSRAGIAEGWEHRCRWCGHKERHQDREQRYCPTCVKRTDGTGKPSRHTRGRLLWPKAVPLKMRFHDLRHTFATELLRQGVDMHPVQRLMRHGDVRVTTGTYAHLLVEDLRAAVDAHAPKPSVPPPPEPPLAAFLLHDAAQGANDPADTPDNVASLRENSGGRSRIRTCDPCRVNRLEVVSRLTQALASTRNHWRS